MKRWLTGLLCAMVSCAVLASGPNEVRKRAETSMLVTGTIEVMPDGGIHSYAIDQPDKLPPVVVDLVQKAESTWKFKASDQVTAIRKAKMSLRIVLQRVDDQHDSLTIAGTNFHQIGEAPYADISYKQRQAPSYPPLSRHSGVSGTVYLLLRVDRQGDVADVAAEQVNLGIYASDTLMTRFRADLADAAIQAAKGWTFNIPTTGQHAADPSWYVRVPVNFYLNSGPSVERYGKWQTYIPGPHEPISWLQQHPDPSATADTTADGDIGQLDQEMQLQNPAGGT